MPMNRLAFIPPPLAVAYRADRATARSLLLRLPLQRVTLLHGRRVIIHRTTSDGETVTFHVTDFGPGAPPANRNLPRMLPFAAT